jgi:hypothetical protein
MFMEQKLYETMSVKQADDLTYSVILPSDKKCQQVGLKG